MPSRVFFAGEDITIDFERTDDGGYKDHDGSCAIITSIVSVRILINEGKR